MITRKHTLGDRRVLDYGVRCSNSTCKRTLWFLHSNPKGKRIYCRHCGTTLTA